MEVTASNRVIARNGLGRFIQDCEQAATETVKELVEEGAKLSRKLAPEGSDHDPRSIPLKQSIWPRMISATSGVWESFSRHAMFVEEDTAPHTIMGSPFFQFYWDNAGRMWIPGLFGEPDVVNHPGTTAQPFLRPAYESIMARAMSVAKSKYPG